MRPHDDLRARPDHPGAAPSELRVLLIEDDENDAALLLRELERLGYRITWERVQTREAMELALHKEWDLLVSDYSMPAFDALGALDLCRERAIDLPFIIVSGTIEEEEAVESMRLGADDFITKGRLARLGPAIVRGLREHGERRALRRAEERLRQAQKMEAIGQLAGGVAHDFNNLLGIIMGYGEMLVQALADERNKARAQQIVQAATQGAALTRQLLAFSRQQPMEARILDLAATIEHVESMLRRLIGETVEIAIVADGRAGRVRADPTQMEQVVMNLVINARDAMPNGGRLIVETSSVDLGDEYAASHPDVTPGPHVLLAVSDNGSGMSAETLSHIFEPFFTTKEAGRGTGLGLATVYGIVRQSGGHVVVYSELDRGTSFKIYLPRVNDAPEEKSVGGAPTVPPRNGNETIVVIEDEASLRDVLVEQLQAGGYKVVTGADAESALVAAEEHRGRIDLVITDVVLPGSSGHAAIRRLRQSRSDLRVLYMSGYTRSAAAQNGPMDPAEAFLQKPFSLESLLRKVREVLEGRGRG